MALNIANWISSTYTQEVMKWCWAIFLAHFLTIFMSPAWAPIPKRAKRHKILNMMICSPFQFNERFKSWLWMASKNQAAFIVATIHVHKLPQRKCLTCVAFMCTNTPFVVKMVVEGLISRYVGPYCNCAKRNCKNHLQHLICCSLLKYISNFRENFFQSAKSWKIMRSCP